MYKSFAFGCIVGIAFLLVGGVAGFQSPKASQNSLQAKERERALFKAEVVDATPVQLNALTEQQQKHSKLYSVLKERSRRKISELITSGDGKVLGIEHDIGLGPGLRNPETPKDYFGKLTNESDVVIRGKVNKKVSQVTEDDAFIFTDYDVVVTEVLKNNAISPLEVGVDMTVTRLGGKILVDGIIVSFKDQRFLPLPLNQDVVLFLKYIPETGTYQTTQDNGSFQLDGEVLRPLTGIQFPPGVLENSTSFLQTLRTIQ
jgi:hypothetical protein